MAKDERLLAHLTPLQYAVTQLGATEPPHSGKYNRHYAPGLYRCVVCGRALFASEAKFASACGWPSFSASIPDATPRELDDFSLSMHRIEVQCPQCGAHLGHLFHDGPSEGGLRYCINSAALVFEASSQSPPSEEV